MADPVTVTTITKEQVIQALKQVHDPEIPVDIYELGLIYEISIYHINNVHVLMPLTSPSCPAAEQLPGQAETNIRAIEGVNDATVEITFEPPYDPKMMSEEAKLTLGFL